MQGKNPEITTGEKRSLELTPPSNNSNISGDNLQISPENKRRCPNPRDASYSSSKNIGQFYLQVYIFLVNLYLCFIN